MLDIGRVIHVPTAAAKAEAENRGAIKKIVDRRFSREDKKQALQNKGVTGDELAEELRKFIPEVILPTSETHLVSDDQRSHVIESGSLALSYASGKGPESPHWHPDEVETYLLDVETKVALRFVDRPEKHRIVMLPPGRVILPARTCHFTDLRGYTEVMSFRHDPAMKRVGCEKCHLRDNGDCSGLAKEDDNYRGEAELVDMATGRDKWLAEQ